MDIVKLIMAGSGREDIEPQVTDHIKTLIPLIKRKGNHDNLVQEGWVAILEIWNMVESGLYSNREVNGVVMRAMSKSLDRNKKDNFDPLPHDLAQETMKEITLKDHVDAILDAATDEERELYRLLFVGNFKRKKVKEHMNISYYRLQRLEESLRAKLRNSIE